MNVSATKVPPWKRPELGDWINNRAPEFDLAAAAVALVAEYTSIPQDAVWALVAALRGAGEVTQRVENTKTVQAATWRVPQAREHTQA
ncbi:MULTISPECIES: hypothetical protein [Streptomyces]|uniref:Uncharacterized protein n=1 Tax=Streptomyces ehimensis TaxID=68195 RepID=A0ABV9BAT8_9ACTN